MLIVNSVPLGHTLCIGVCGEMNVYIIIRLLANS